MLLRKIYNVGISRVKVEGEDDMITFWRVPIPYIVFQKNLKPLRPTKKILYHTYNGLNPKRNLSIILSSFLIKTWSFSQSFREKQRPNNAFPLAA